MDSCRLSQQQWARAKKRAGQRMGEWTGRRVLRGECFGSHNFLDFHAGRHERRVIVVRAFPDLLPDAEDQQLHRFALAHESSQSIPSPGVATCATCATAAESKSRGKADKARDDVKEMADKVRTDVKEVAKMAIAEKQAKATDAAARWNLLRACYCLCP